MAKKPVKRWVEGGVMPRWMRRYALWLTSKGGELSGTKAEYRGRYPTAEERSKKAGELAGRAVQVQLVALLEKRQDFRDYFEALQASNEFLAKELVQQRLGKNFEARDAGLDMALEAKDHKAIEHFTRSAFEYGLPKKHESEGKAPRIVINLIGASEERKKLWLEDTIDEVEYEVIESDKLLTDGDDD